MGQVTLAIAIAIGCSGMQSVAIPKAARVRPGIDVLLTDSLHLIRGKRIGLVTNLAAVSADGESVVARMRAAPVSLAALFGPEHGLSAAAAPGERVASSVDSATQIPIYSLYGATHRPTPEMLKGIEVLVVDLPDVGARYYTYPATTILVMQAAAEAKIPVIIADRPNPIGGAVQGNVLDTAFSSMVGRLAVPMRHGLTLGEEARLAASDLHIPVQLTVVPAANWRRDITFESTGLPFRAPSPNLKDLESLFHYPGLCLFEGTALSVGRGTEFPFHQIGAPWLDTTAVLAIVRSAKLPGVRFEGVSFTPHGAGDQKWSDSTVRGIRLHLTNRESYDPTVTAVHLLAAVHKVHPQQIALGGIFDKLAGGSALRHSLLGGDPPTTIIAGWQPDVQKFRERVRPVLLYQ